MTERPSHLEALSLADWRRHISSLYAQIRAADAPERAHQLWRKTRDDLFRYHPQSPIPPDRRAAYPGAPLFDYDPDYRCIVDVVPVGPAASTERDEIADGGDDGAIRFSPIGLTSGLKDVFGAELTLYWIQGYGGGLFLPFRDATNGDETYRGGRYLLDGIKGADLGEDEEGRLILDFNFAYHPSCAHNPRWICPLSPPENQLDQGVRAGEKIDA